MPVGSVVGIIQRANQDMVVSMAEEDQKAVQSRQATSKSVRPYSCIKASDGVAVVSDFDALVKSYIQVTQQYKDLHS